MILVLDAGNTNIEFGVFSSEIGSYEVLASARYFTKLNITSDEMAFFVLKFLEVNSFVPSDFDRMVYSSVVPQMNSKFEKMYRDYFAGDIIQINSKIALGINNKYKNPSEVGADRLVNAAIAYNIFKKNLIIVDMGTATTLCVVTEGGDYLGGVIVPGVLTSSQALFDKAAKLPAVSIGKKTRILSDNTTEAIESGIYFSNLYSIKGMVAKLAEEVGFDRYMTIGTGGFSAVYDDTGLFDVIDGDLSIKGLKYISDINKNDI